MGLGLGNITSTLLKPISVMDTGSQVCNLLWSKNVNEIVSTPTSQPTTPALDSSSAPSKMPSLSPTT